VCGISDKMRNVSQAIGPTGIIQVCSRCAKNEGFILLKKPKIAEVTKKETVYERMARLAGVKPKPQEERRILRMQEKSLREIIDKNYEEKLKSQTLALKPRPDLVDNFHWIIMRVRRVKGLTQRQLAERISEPEAAIKMAEQGIVPEGYALIDKLERFLGVKLIKQRDLTLSIKKQQEHIIQQLQQSPNQQSQQAETFHFDKNLIDSLTIGDLKKIQEESETIIEENREEQEKEENKKTKPFERLDYE